MSSHYFDKNPTSISKEKLITYKIGDKSLSLITDTNVFAKNGVDYGTDVLLKTIVPKIHAGKVLDIGCGYGVIGLTLASLILDIHVMCSDINSRAISLSNKNARNLELSERVTILQSNLYENIEGKFDYIVSNPPIRVGKAVLYELYKGASERIKKGGFLYIVVRKKQGAESTVNYLSTIFNKVEVLNKDKGYWIISASK